MSPRGARRRAAAVPEASEYDGGSGRDPGETEERVRLDRWLWAARFLKTRSLAAEAIGAGKAQVNGERAKRAKLVQAGDEVRLRLGPYEYVLHVRRVSTRRGKAAEAATLYEETAASKAARDALAAQMKSSAFGFAYDAGRPSKRERRQRDRFEEERRKL